MFGTIVSGSVDVIFPEGWPAETCTVGRDGSGRLTLPGVVGFSDRQFAGAKLKEIVLLFWILVGPCTAGRGLTPGDIESCCVFSCC